MNWVKTDRGFEFGGWVVGPPPNEETLAVAYIQMKQAGILDKVFHQNGVPDLRWFLNWMLDPQTHLIGCWRLISDVAQFQGCGFVNSPSQMDGYKKCEVGFTFMPGDTSPFTKASLIRAMISYAFDRFDMDVMFGTTPERNPGAVAVIKRAGMRVFGPIPNFCTWHGELCGAWISQVDKQSWLNK